MCILNPFHFEGSRLGEKPWNYAKKLYTNMWEHTYENGTHILSLALASAALHCQQGAAQPCDISSFLLALMMISHVLLLSHKLLPTLWITKLHFSLHLNSTRDAAHRCCLGEDRTNHMCVCYVDTCGQSCCLFLSPPIACTIAIKFQCLERHALRFVWREYSHFADVQACFRPTGVEMLLTAALLPRNAPALWRQECSCSRTVSWTGMLLCCHAGTWNAPDFRHAQRRGRYGPVAP